MSAGASSATVSFVPVAHPAPGVSLPAADSRLEAARRTLVSPIERTTLFCAFLLICFNLIDAFGTLRHVGLGAEEVNPLMDALLQRGPLTFFVGKHLLACLGVIGIVAHANHKAARVALKGVLLPLYGCIATYQIVLLFLVR